MDSFLDFALERLSIAGQVTAKPMFGGHGIYLEDLIIGMVVESTLYLKVDDSNIKDYIQAGVKPFSYEAKNGKPISMSYWCLPADILESNEDLPKWLNKAVEAARASKKNKTKKHARVKSKVAAIQKKKQAKTKTPASKKQSKKKPAPAKKKAKKKATAKKKGK
ncbi:MAG TPA: TfoX/Sxy family protein [Leptospiraceae bacterium]|nr:TfoX/Sxy family protein [Leptospiraceae bacterium]HMW03744.1 TfoX/Sxy family protein [Leptospiraceae bacterium]HMX31857.1 TfoX/Sxy family protein [Leptospiraceae bacterium]HMY29724.1 TfoX/Sxy family protein [Leptospiraceae bacterium]HMZ62877.1 TfoX/Sxy family protein [Leptospiraceae bacterium]